VHSRHGVRRSITCVRLPNGAVARAPRFGIHLLFPILALILGCRQGDSRCPRCTTLVVAATGNPDALLPPLVGGTVGRDISDLIYERLATLPARLPPADSSAYRTGLAVRWERVDSVTLRFHLRSKARWHDGRPVTARDVAFSFEAYGDSALDASARATIARLTVEAPDDSTVLVRFPEPDPEQWYTATWFVRVLPRHIWDSLPRSEWAKDTATARLIGSGPYRLSGWNRGQSLTLERSSSGPGSTIARVVWRFAGDPDAALNLLLSHEADLIETVGDSARVARVRADSEFVAVDYPAAVYGFLGFNLNGATGSPVRSREVRRALALAVDRNAAARAVFGTGAVAPPGPMSRILWIYDSTWTGIPFDGPAAGRALDEAGWARQGRDSIRTRNGKTLALDILVPGTSLTRRNLAQILQETWRKLGVRATVTSVDFPVFQERLRSGRFDSFIGAWLDEPSPRHLAEQWTGRGIGKLNYTGYRNPRFDSLLDRAAWFRGPPGEARAAWREALDTLNADGPAIWLYNPTQVAGIARRLEGVAIDPYSWLSGLPGWRVRSEK
jgi:peptide/nickel transport system substrate-binding protein